MKKYLLKRDINKVKYLFFGVMILIMVLAFVGGLVMNFLSSSSIYSYETNIVEVFFSIVVFIIGFVVVIISGVFIPYVFFMMYQNDKKEASVMMIDRRNYRYLVYQRTIMVTIWLVISLLLGYLVFDLVNSQTFRIENLLDIPFAFYNYIINIGLGIVFLSLILVNLLLTKTKRFLFTLITIIVAFTIIIFNFVMLPSGWIVAIGEQVYLYGNIVFILSAFTSYFLAVELLIHNINKRLEL